MGSPRVLGIFCMMAATLFFALVNATVKSIVLVYPASQLVFFRLLFALLPIAGLFLMNKERPSLQFKNPAVSLFSGFTLYAALMTLFLTLPYLPFSQATVLSYSSTLFITLLAKVLFKETLGWQRLGAIGVGFIAVLITSESLGSFNYYSLLMVLFGLMDASIMMGLKRLNEDMHPQVAVLFITGIATALSVLTLFMDWISPSFEDFILLSLLGIGGGIGQIFLSYAYKLAPASHVAPFIFSGTLWAFILGVLMFDETITWILLVGATLLISAGIYLVREKP